MAAFTAASSPSRAPAAQKRKAADALLDEDHEAIRACGEEMADVEVVIEGSTVRVHSAVLALASPVFAALLRSHMREGLTKVLELPGKSKEEFEIFLAFLRPASRRRVTEDNVDILLPWFDEYQVETLKAECEDMLLGMPCSVSRLLQAKSVNLQRQYQRCLDEFPPANFIAGFAELTAEPEIVRDLLPYVQEKAASLGKISGLIGKLLDNPTALKQALPVLQVCLQKAHRLDCNIVQAVQRLLDPEASFQGAAAVLSMCLDAPEKVRADVSSRVRAKVDSTAQAVYDLLPGKNAYDCRAKSMILEIKLVL